MNSAQATEKSFVDLFRAVAKHWKLSAGFMLVTSMVTLLVFWYFPRSYSSESTLYIREGRETASLDAAQMVGRPSTGPLMNTGLDSEVNSVAEVLQSRLLMERVVDAIGPEQILGHSAEEVKKAREADGPLRRWLTQVANFVSSIDVSGTLTDRDRAVRKLQKTIDVERVRKSDVVRVTCKSYSPKLAQEIVGKLVDCYLEEHVRLNRTHGAHDFLEHQTADMRKQLVQAEDDLRKLKDETGIVSPEDQRTLIVTKAARLEDELLTTSATLASTEAEVKMLRERLTSLPEQIVTASTDRVPNHDSDLMRNELYRLQMTEHELASRYTDEHYLVKQIRERTANAKEALDSAEESRAMVTSGPNEIYEAAAIKLVEQESLLTSLHTKAEVLESQLAQVREDLKKFNAGEVQIAQLDRDQKRLEEDYKTYSQHLEQARIDDALAVGQISSINVVQPATFEPKAVTLKTSIILFAGLLFGMVGALGLPLLIESLNAPLVHPHDVETELGVPVLASIPRFTAEQLTGKGEGTPNNGGNGIGANGNDS